MATFVSVPGQPVKIDNYFYKQGLPHDDLLQDAVTVWWKKILFVYGCRTNLIFGANPIMSQYFLLTFS